MKKGLNINELTVEQKIGLIMTGRALDSFDNFEFALELVKKNALGGIQGLYDEKFEKYCRPLIEAAEYPLLVAGDMECGFPKGDLKISYNISLGINNRKEDVYTFAKATAKQAKKYGYNMIWGPVVDLSEFDRPMSVSRSFGADGKKVAEFATEYMRAFGDCGVVGTAKHYPSATDGVYDSHMKANHCQTSAEKIHENTYSYRYMVEQLGENMTGLMTGHNIFEKIDPEYPTSLSKKMIDLIKDEKFKGLVVTDSLAMMGISQSFGRKEALGLAVAAGNDLLLVNQTIPLRESYNYLLECYNEGVFTEERLNDAVERVIRAQNFTLRQPETLEITKEEIETIERINRDSICVVADEGVPTALDKDAKHLFVVSTQNAYDLEFLGDIGEVPAMNWYDPKEVAEFLEENFPNSTIMYASEFPHWRQVHKACMLSEKGVHDDVVYITFCDINAYQGTDSLTERMRMLIECTAYNVAAVVHFGNPYAMQKIVHVPKIVFGPANKQSVKNTLKVLAGEYEPKGVMPLPLKLK